MSLTLITITGAAKDASGVALSGVMTFKPLGVFGGSGIVVPSQDVTTDIAAVTGAFTVSLYAINIANTFVRYLVTFPNGDTAVVAIAADGPTALDALISQSDFTNFELSNMLAALTALSAVRVVTETTDTIVLADKNNIITFNNALPITVTVPASLGAGFTCLCIQTGVGQVTFVGSGATLQGRNGLKIAGQYGVASLVAYAANVFAIGGDVTT